MLSHNAHRIIILLILNLIPVLGRNISLVEFQDLLYSELNSEIEELSKKIVANDGSDSDQHHEDRRLNGRFLREEDVTLPAEALWKRVVQHGWDLSQSTVQDILALRHTQEKNRRRLDHVLTNFPDDLHKYHPFLVCSETPSETEKSGFRRLEPLLKLTGALLEDNIIVRNDPNKTCAHVSMKYEVAQNLRESIERKENEDKISIVPLTDLMKIQVDTLTMIYEDSWTVPRFVSPDDWERLIRVGLSAGHRINIDTNEAEMIVDLIMRDMKSFGSKKRQHNRGLRARPAQNVLSRDTSSLLDIFSVTAMTYDLDHNMRRKLSAYDIQNRWIRALHEGLGSDHFCEAMFNSLEVDVHKNNQGFDIMLNPRKKSTTNDNDGIEKQTLKCEEDHQCLASNTHCVASLVMALSTHPLVLSIEAESPIVTSDYESQWITQSKVKGKRPLRDIGITGKNQVISVIDSGLDIDHKYFGPTDPKVFNQWDHSQRKVVRYDRSIGDNLECKGGHGTKVAGAAVGRSRDDENDVANGIAEDAKLHIFDIQKGSGAYRMPSAITLFESMHSTKDRPARIANGSWHTKYRAYPFSCRFFDEALHGEFQGDVYVASAGNEGFDESLTQSKQRTIGNPASCKNTLAVGASQSHGDRISQGVLGIDYLAAFSSRGPTYDGRMKPDVVAPGASVLTAYAHESGSTVQAYGTSFAGPIVAGNAALVRQYFEEGHLPCSSGNCSLDPSGSLIKAVLMNGANPLKQVQVARPWLTKHMLEKVDEYDNQNGMGLIQLDTSLPIVGHNKISAVVRNNKVIGDGQNHDIFIRATPWKCVGKVYKRHFSATLAWYDPAGASSCAKCLLNDLDIVVQRINPRGMVIQNSEKYPNGASSKDHDNNVERIRFKMLRGRRYRIRIKASNIVSAETKYSMIATGCFNIIQNPATRGVE